MGMHGDVLLVGSVPGASAEDAMRLCASGLGTHLACLPDGETGRRRAWINFLAAGAYAANADLHTVSRPLPIDPSVANEWRPLGEDWIPRGYADHWSFRLRHAARLHFPTLGYADVARASYAVFTHLKAEGVVAPGLRFMVALPLIESATRPFCAEAGDFPSFALAYEDAIAREIASMLASIPADELVLQWDIAFETLAIETDDHLPGVFPWQPAGSALERYQSAVQRAARMVPAAVTMGLHLCYGDLGHQHVIEPPTLATCVRMANIAHTAAARPIDFYHMPVPRDRDDDAYFAPLAGLDIGAARLYLGLVHHSDGAAGSRRRLTTARRHAQGFGIATECGFGRRAPATIPALLAIHCELLSS